MKKEYIPILERDSWTYTDRFDNENALWKHHQAELEREADEYDKCTFHPEISPEGKAHTVDELIQWGKEKRQKHASLRLRQMEEDGHEFTYRPRITNRSREIMKNREKTKSKEKPEDRLMSYGVKKKKRMKEKRKESTKGLFTPHINKKSREILIRKNSKEIDVKVLVPNGETKNCKFYHAKKRRVGIEDESDHEIDQIDSKSKNPKRKNFEGKNFKRKIEKPRSSYRKNFERKTVKNRPQTSRMIRHGSTERLTRKERNTNNKRRVKSKDNYYFKNSTNVNDLGLKTKQNQNQKSKKKVTNRPDWNGDFSKKMKKKKRFERKPAKKVDLL